MKVDLTAINPGVGAASYWEPSERILSAWREHAPFGSWLISALQPSCIVELGTHSGYSFFVFAEAVKRLGLDTRLYAIDTWEGDDQAGFYSEDIFRSVSTLAKRDYAGYTELIRTYFSEAVSRFADGTVDLLHIDGRHGYDDVREDFEMYRPKLSSGSVVLFHNTQEFQEGFGVHRFWSELALSRPSFEFHHGHGLGVLLYGDDVPAPVSQFFAACATDSQSLRNTYERLGGNLTHRAEEDERREWLEREVQRLEGAVAIAVDERLSAQRDLALVRDSASWRVTSPIRAITGLVPRRPK